LTHTVRFFRERAARDPKAGRAFMELAAIRAPGGE
jgi:hypothetical protein